MRVLQVNSKQTDCLSKAAFEDGQMFGTKARDKNNRCPTGLSTQGEESSREGCGEEHRKEIVGCPGVAQEKEEIHL